MKQYTKPFFITVFLIAMSIFMLIFRKYEQESILSYPVINREEADALIAGKQLIPTYADLLYYQEQPLPFMDDLNTFLIPTDASSYITNAISCAENGDIYLIPKETGVSEAAASGELAAFSVYIANDSSYYETSVLFIPSAVLTFQTENFESENAYGHMYFYMPADDEIGMYSFKSSEAKLSYEITDARLPQIYRNYTLKLTKMGVQNKMNLANLRKDDDWELDSLLDFPDQILQFYEDWNDFCINMGKSQYIVHYQPIEFYLDGQYMGKYLLRVPLDAKQLNYAEGAFFTEETAPANTFDDSEIDVLQNLFDNMIADASIHLECYFWMEEKNNIQVTHVIPRRFIKYITD